MNITNLIPTPYRALAGAVAVALILIAIYSLGRSHGADAVRAKWNAETIIQQQAAHAAELNARAKEQALMNKAQEAQNAATARETKLRADYAAARSAALGLRDTVDALRRGLSADSVEACRATADAALAVFGECQARYGAVAEAADGHASDAAKFADAWPE